ncbi:SRPBCC domain-containing protein [uncultured Tateyamaria sp.]|uniref:SRPBCC family protein n=1 Tax=uncultured Tateyamaria sp. TaxID=455651 RepID=UPI0026138763|nr:SRPBCC domain-containing protein [uncultured Tateyamaria sp.]
MNDLNLTVERTIKAAQTDVFNAWLNPDMLRQFMMPASGMSVSKASNEPKEGGRFEIVMVAGEDEIPHSGTYREISPHDRIVFTWESPYSVEDSTVTLAFAPTEDGTRVTLTHVRFRDEETRDNHQGGWTGILGALETALAA